MSPKTPGPARRIVFEDRELDAPALADAVSLLHERLSRYGVEHVHAGPGAARLAASVENGRRAIRDAVAEATESYVRPPRTIRPNPLRQLVARAAVATVNGMTAARRAATVDPALVRNLREVVPAMVADAVRSDARRLDHVVRSAASDAARKAADLMRMATAKATHDYSRISEGFAPLDKFSRGATVMAAGAASPARTGRVLRCLATAALVGTVSFAVVQDAHAQQRHGGGRVAVAMDAPAPSIDELFAKSFGGAVRPPSVPGMGGGAAAPVRNVAPQVQAVVQQPAARAPEAAPAARVVPPPVFKPSQADLMAVRGAGRNNPYSDVKNGPSQAFLDLAGAALGAHTSDVGEARKRVAALMDTAEACLKGNSAPSACRVSSDGLDFDFATGSHKITMLPVPGLTTQPTLLAYEKGGSMTVVDTSLMTVAQGEASNYDIAMGSGTVGYEEPDEEAGAPRPR